MENAVVKRQSNFELLRIVSMLMIIASHLACHGVQHVLDVERAFTAYDAGSFANRLFTSFLSLGGSAGVALFFMLTGYFVCRKESCSIKKVALQSAFYSFVLGLVFIVLSVLPYMTGGGRLYS